MSGNNNPKAKKNESDVIKKQRNNAAKESGVEQRYESSKNTPAKMLKRDIDDVDPNSPSPQRNEGIIKVKESELLVQIKRIVTEVIQKELKTKVEELEVKVGSNALEIEDLKLKQNVDKVDLEQRISNLDMEFELLKTSQVDDKEELDKKVEELHISLEKSKNETKILKEELLTVEKRERRLNLKFINIPDRRGETPAECERAFLNALNKSGIPINPLSITKAYRIGVITSKRPARPMIVSFHHAKQRSYVLYNSKELNRACNVRVEEDLSEEIRLRRKVLFPIFKEARKTTRAKLIEDTLTIDGKKYNINSIHTLPKHLQPEQISTKEKGDMIAFFSFQSVYSNHYRCDFKLRGKDFNCSEQAFMYHKALLFEDDETADEILKTIDPARQKGLGRNVRNYDDNKWQQNKDRIMHDALTAKFSQNQYLKTNLIKTNNKMLVECNPNDPYWGIGLDLSDNKIWEQGQWKGANKLGEMLGQIREDLR